ncbi:MAG: CBS domain-containing protein [Candidatus Aenigmarchaeota archaeon]|nr:CBS domain-containing protein [Candidatus Aenigmarchaeota archaeon]
MDKEDDITDRLNELLKKQEKLKKHTVKSKQTEKTGSKKSVARKTKPIKKSKPAARKKPSTKNSNSKIKRIDEKKSPKKSKHTLSLNEDKNKLGSNIKSKFMSLFRKSTPTKKNKPIAKEVTKETKPKEIERAITKETKQKEIKKPTAKEKGTLVRKDGASFHSFTKTNDASSLVARQRGRMSEKMNETTKNQLIKKNTKKSGRDVLDAVTVAEVMKKAEIMDIESPVVEVVRMFSEKKCNGIFISKKGKVVGLIILPDILNVLRKKKKIAKLKAGDIIGNLICLAKGDSLSKAILSMHLHKSGCIAVMSHKEVVGVVTRSVILNKMARNIFSTEDEGVIGNIIETKVDKLLDLLRKKETNMKELEERLNIDEEKIEEWLEILENHNLIKYKKSLFGKISVEHVK